MIDPRKMRTDEILVQVIAIPGGLTDERAAYTEVMMSREDFDQTSGMNFSHRYGEAMIHFLQVQLNDKK